MTEDREWQHALKTAHVLETFVALSYGLAALALGMIPIPWQLKPVLFMVLGIHYSYGACTRIGHGFPWSLKAVRWDGQGRWWLHLASGQVRSAYLLPSTYISTRFVVLRFRAKWRCYSVPLWADRHNEEALRQLRVRLRRSAHPSDN